MSEINEEDVGQQKAQPPREGNMRVSPGSMFGGAYSILM